jgi:hypothetical protein
VNNKNIQHKAVAMALLAGLYSSVSVAETATGVATANVITPLVISNLVTMDFGDVASGSSGGDITMASGGGLSVTAGDADIVGSTTGTSLTFDITGEANQAYTLTVSDGVLANASNSLQTMDIATTDPAGPTLTGGADSVEVTGVLSLGAEQASGSYSTANTGGTPITITANYD